MLTSQYGLTLVPIIAYFDESGTFIGAECKRVEDGEQRYYATHQMRHEDGAVGVQKTLDAAPEKEPAAE